MSRKGKVTTISFSLILIICTLYFYINPNAGFFTYRFIGQLMLDQGDGSLTVSLNSNVPGLKPFLAIFQTITGLEYYTITILPVAVFGRWLLYYALLRHFTESNIISNFGALAIAANPWQGWGYNILFVHGIGSILFLTFIFAIFRGRSQRGREFIPIQIIIFIGLFLLDYTATGWAFGLVAGLEVLSLKDPRRRGNHLGVLLVMIALIPYKLILYKVFTDAVQASPTPTVPEAYQYTAVEASEFGISRVYYSAIIGVGLLYGVWVFGLLYSREFPVPEQDRQIAALAIAGALVTGIYLRIGRFTQFFIYLCSPLIGLMAADRLEDVTMALRQRRRFLSNGLAIVLVVSATIAYGGIIIEEWDTVKEDQDGQVGVFMVDYSDESPEILADLDTHGRMLMGAAANERTYSHQSYSLQNYSDMVEGRQANVDYIVVDYTDTDGVTAPGWVRFANLQKFKNEIDSAPVRNKIYSNTNQVYQE